MNNYEVILMNCKQQKPRRKITTKDVRGEIEREKYFVITK